MLRLAPLESSRAGLSVRRKASALRITPAAVSGSRSATASLTKFIIHTSINRTRGTFSFSLATAKRFATKKSATCIMRLNIRSAIACFIA
jgi:hypothetical protein